MVKLVGLAATLKAMDMVNKAALEINKAKSKKVAQRIKETQQELAPKKEHTLEGSISIDEKQYRESCWYRIGPADDLDPTSKGIPYSVLQEFGITQMAAQPYVRPSADAHHGELEKEYKDGFSKL